MRFKINNNKIVELSKDYDLHIYTYYKTCIHIQYGIHIYTLFLILKKERFKWRTAHLEDIALGSSICDNF